ncbi:MAG: PAS domain S-box protein [bacterium]
MWKTRVNTTCAKIVRILALSGVMLLAAGIGRESVCYSLVPSADTTGTIVLPHSEDYPPFFYVDDGGASQGILVDYWQLWSARTGIPVRFEPHSWHECIELVRSGQADVIPGIFYSAERDAVLDFSQAFLEVKTVLYVRKSLEVDRIDELETCLVGVTRGDRAADYLADNVPSARLQIYDGFQQLAQAAAAGEVDAFAMDRPCALYYLRALGAGEQFEPLQTLFVGKFCAAVQEGNRALLIDLNYGIELIHEDDINDIFSRFMPQPVIPAWVVRAVLIGLAVVVALMLIWHIVVLRLRVYRRTCMLQSARRKYEVLFENATDGVGVCQDGRYNFVSPSMTRITGYSESELTSRNRIELIHPDDRSTVVDCDRQLAGDHKTPVSAPVRIICVSGEICWVQWTTTRIDWEGEPALLDFVTDISDLMRAREALKEAEAQVRTIVEVSPVPLIITRMSDGMILYANDDLGKLAGYDKEELVGQFSPDFYYDLNDRKQALQALKRDGQIRNFEVRLKKRDGRVIWTIFSLIATELAGEKVIMGGIYDITESKAARDTLARRLRYEEGLAECSRALLEGNDKDSALRQALGHLLTSSRSSRAYIFENFEDDIDGLCMRQTHEVCAEGIEPQIDNELLQHVPYGGGFERWRDMLSRGEAVVGSVASLPESERAILAQQGIISILALPITVAGKWYGFIGFDDCKCEREAIQEDIRLLRTAAEMIGAYIESKRFEAALRVSEERFRSLVENATEVIFSLTPDGRFSYLSPQFAKATGFEVSEVLGQLVYEGMHPDDRGNTRLWVEAGMPQDEGLPAGYEFRIRARDGSWRWFVSNSSIIRDEKGDVIEAIGVAHDITEMKKVLQDLKQANRNLRDAQTQLVQSEKMASLGMLVAGVAHEINTPVGAINSMHDTQVRAVERLRAVVEQHRGDDPKLRDKVFEYLTVIEDANRVIESGSSRVTNIVTRLRSFARLDEAELKKVDIHEGLEDTLTLIHHEIKHRITIERNYGDIPMITCYPGQLNQVFLNILINARQAIEDTGVITISTFMKDAGVHVVIKDSGRGIPAESLPRIFDPGFTTKGVGVGTGLGLSICYQIVQDHRGWIRAESKPGQGTRFTIILPTDLDKQIT